MPKVLDPHAWSCTARVADFELAYEKMNEMFGRIQGSLKGRANDHTESCHRLAQIRDTQGLYILPNTVIGVVGSTGARKSSLINVVLDEERLV